MKKSLKKIPLVALLVMLTIGITGCDNNDSYYGSSQNVRDCYNAGVCKTVWK